MAPHTSTVAWKIPWMEEPGRLQSMGSLTVGHDWATSLSLSIFMHWRRKWQPTPVFLPGESHGRRSLVGCSPWGPQSRTWLKRLSSSSLFRQACFTQQNTLKIHSNFSMHTNSLVIFWQSRILLYGGFTIWFSVWVGFDSCPGWSW